MSQRAEQVAEELRKIISMILLEDITDPRIGFVTITRVEITNDLRHAKIFYSVYGTDEQKEVTDQGLKSNLKHIKKLAIERINLKFAPEFKFEQDITLGYSFGIDQILKKIKDEEEKNKPGSEEKKEPDEV